MFTELWVPGETKTFNPFNPFITCTPLFFILLVVSVPKYEERAALDCKDCKYVRGKDCKYVRRWTLSSVRVGDSRCTTSRCERRADHLEPEARVAAQVG